MLHRWLVSNDRSDRCETAAQRGDLALTGTSKSGQNDVLPGQADDMMDAKRAFL